MGGNADPGPDGSLSSRAGQMSDTGQSGHAEGRGPIMRRRGTTRAAGISVIVAAGTALVPGGTATAVVRPAVSPRTAVHRIGLQPVDLRGAGFPPGAALKAMDGGDQVGKGPGVYTLSGCGYTFRSEAYRVARHQTTVTLSGSSFGVSSEVVAYDTPAHAALALTEWRTSVQRCRTKIFLPPNEAGEPSVRVDTITSQRHAGLPARDYSWTVEQVTNSPSGRHLTWINVLQQHGRYLDIVWGSSTPGPTITPQRSAAITAAAVATGRRLLAF